MKFALSAASIGLSLLMTQITQAAEVKAFVTGAARARLSDARPAIRARHRTQAGQPLRPAPALVRKIDAGEPYDVIILSYDVEALIKQGKVVADSRTVFGRVGVGVAVRQGSPKPDFSTVEAFKRSLLDAKTFATSGEGSSGRYVASLIDRLGIAEQVKPKIRSGAAGASAQWCRAAKSTSWCRGCRR